jgi:hypothetical protein
MRRKVYTSGSERKHDQHIGAIAFVVVNVFVWLVYQWLIAPTYIENSRITRLETSLAVQLMPWMVNGVFLLWAFIFRSQIGVGYITAFAAILFAGLTLVVLVVGSCIISLPFVYLAESLGIVVFGGVAILGFIWFLIKAFEAVTAWWSVYEDTTQDQQR